jgi:ADP-ribosyl-[dinitrogen reductase] hydrolase
MGSLAADEIGGSAWMRSRGAGSGDALGMPLEFGPKRHQERLVRDMTPGRLPAGTFTDDTEMGLALAESLLAHRPLDPADFARQLVAWYRAGPDDVGNHTRAVLSRVARGQAWEQAAEEVQRGHPDSAGNGSVMRCWPVALAHWDDLAQLERDSALQSRVTHPHRECVAGSAFVNVVTYWMLHGTAPREAISRAAQDVELPDPLRAVIERAPTATRRDLINSGWVRHTVESAVWGLLTNDSFAEAVIQVVNLGNDADTAGAVVGAWAGAAYGLESIPDAWRRALRGEWPLGSGQVWTEEALGDLAERLAGV